MLISEVIKALEQAKFVHGDVKVLVGGEHNEFVVASTVSATHVENINEYYVQLQHEDDVDDSRDGVFDAVVIE